MSEQKFAVRLSHAHEISDASTRFIAGLAQRFNGDMSQPAADDQLVVYTIQMTHGEYRQLDMQMMMSRELRLSRG